MRKDSKKAKNRIFFRLILPLLSLVAAGCITAAVLLSNSLVSQKQAERWQGESEQSFAQLSCYIPVHETVGLEEVHQFRMAMQEQLHSAALDLTGDSVLFVDAWSTTGKLKVSSELGTGEAAVYAVGGSFFDFHPIRLLSGSYLNEADLMKDRVLLDEDLAWLLFGGTDLEGMSMRIEGQPFYVAGVVERSADRESSLAYESGMGLFMSFDAYMALKESAAIGCYEFVMAEPVEGFAANFAKEKFPLKSAVIIENTGRFSLGSLLEVIKDFGKRSMQTAGVIYPYWENAARYIEDWCALLLFIGLMAAVCPLVTAIVFAIRLFGRGKRKLSDELLPRAKENAEEAIRIRQRRRWEKKHGLHEKK